MTEYQPKKYLVRNELEVDNAPEKPQDSIVPWYKPACRVSLSDK
jgi:hypothetical protein